MDNIRFFCDAQKLEQNTSQQIQAYAQNPHIQSVVAFTDAHFCDEKAVPVGVAFSANDYFYPLITGKDIGCGVMYLKISKNDWLKPFDKAAHYKGLQFAHTKMTDDGLGGGNHFLSIEEDETDIYILCHTGTRDRGIGLYHHCYTLTQQFSQAYGQPVEFVAREFVDDKFLDYYQQTLDFGYKRRKNFCLKTLIFLQNAHYIQSDKLKIPKNYLSLDYADLPETGNLYGVNYQLGDSVHNHLSFGTKDSEIIHRKGSTALSLGKTVVIPLSMTRGSLLVRLNNSDPELNESALYSCAHGAGRQYSRFDTVKYWKTTLKEKERKAYKQKFSEMLDNSGEFPMGYVQEFDFAYKDHSEIFEYQPYLKKITQTSPIVTLKYTEI
jgi:tRNA-splicing ligase RtcB/release factor H-coupled RctB family protein